MRARPGFTLFECAIALLLMGVAILGVALLFPAGIRAQQMSRFRLLASHKMMEISHHFTTQSHRFPRRATEAGRLGDASFTVYGPTLEKTMQDWWEGTLPLPDTIAQRLDSDDDEIARVLAGGGHLYYTFPRPPMVEKIDGNAPVGAERWMATDLLQSEVRQMVFAVVGNPQQDALLMHPSQAWPYFDSFPSPPTRIRMPHEADVERDRESWTLHGWPGLAELDALAAIDPAHVYEGSSATTTADADLHLRRCRDLAIAAGVALDADQVPLPPAALPQTWSEGDANAFPPPWRVLAMRYLAHAAMLRTGPRFADAGAHADHARRVHESCLAWTQRYAATDAYDWGAGRPHQQVTSFHWPLVEFDLFSPPIAVDDGGGDNDRSWRVLCPQDVRHVGRTRGVDGLTAGECDLPAAMCAGGRRITDSRADIAAGWGDRRHATITRRFAAAERCRAVVFWAVDWQAYEDFETAPSARWDARLFPADSRGTYVRFNALSNDGGGPPERQLAFWDPARTVLGTYGANPGAFGFASSNGVHAVRADSAVGQYGADRNGDGDCDRGPLPAALRLRASTIARFAFYDKRLFTSLRN